MAKQPTPAPAAVASTFDESTTLAPLNQLATLQQETNERVVALAATLNYQGSTDVASLTNSARDAIRRIGMGIFELGGYLLLLKEGCAHGSFGAVLDDLGINQQSANKYMVITKRFSNSSSTKNLERLGLTRMVELLPLDDDQLDHLVEEGQTGELALDDVATMSVKQLRAKVREARLDKQADDKLLAGKNATIDKLSRHIQKATPDQVLLELQKEATSLMNDALGCIRGNLRQAFIQIKNHDDNDHSLFMAGLLGQVQVDLAALRQEFNLPDLSTAADAQLAAEVAQWAGS